MSLTISEWQHAVYLNEVAKGFTFVGEEQNVGEKIALITSELSEALEEERAGKPVLYYDPAHPDKPEGVGVEMADAVIRILGFCEHRDINLEALIELKHEYNKTRPHRHGGKKF